jgi:hypothetical protein
LIGLRIGIERALPVIGLISGAFHKVATEKPMSKVVVLTSQQTRLPTVILDLVAERMMKDCHSLRGVERP